MTRFGQSGAIEDVYRYHRIDTDCVVTTALDLID
ncbi:pyruvate dehydrogenase complex dehydrogenase (E1) component [Streptomyces demainii]|uniref:Pyruvate dehydrogenase complex dehydrogenase (E1) component n=1 Tax=Streptomyces demainii TaxID=588122 RepID=A0ABT9L4L6_9ACTN|nr:pyruvate dehydrogenase complex dehydrogenase (E1) component [Streptomyces demainii]